MTKEFQIKPATINDVPLILKMINEFAEHEKLLHEFVATEEMLRESLFGERTHAEVIFSYYEDRPIGFAVFFHTFSTLLGRPGIYLEDLYVNPEMRGRGFGKQMFVYLAKLAKERNCGHFEWSVQDWNQSAIDFHKSISATPKDEWTVFRMDSEALDSL